MVLTLLILPNLFSQTDYKNSFDVKAGISDFHIMDETAASLIFRNKGIMAGLGYQWNKPKYRHLIEANYYYSSLDSKYEQYFADNYRLGVRYNYLRKVGISRHVNFWVGGGVYSFIYYFRLTNKVPQIIDGTETYYLSHTAEFSLLSEYAFNGDNKVNLMIHLPLLSFVSRPGYSYDVVAQKSFRFKLFGKASPFWENKFIQIGLFHRHNLNKGWILYGKYDFQYFSYPEPRKVSLYMNNFSIGTNFLF